MINSFSFKNCLYLHLVIYLHNYFIIGFPQFVSFIISFILILILILILIVILIVIVIVIVILYRFISHYLLDFVNFMIG